MRIQRDFFVGLLLIMAATGAGVSVPGDQAPIQLGSRLELFVDDFLIDRMTGVRIQMQRPQSAGQVIAYDQPWEGNTSWTLSVFKDGDRYRLYYVGRAAPDYVRKAGLTPAEVVIPEHPNFLCYAESRDGIQWTRPSLGLFEFKGSKNNNIVTDKGPGTPFLDTNPKAPASERYKAVGSTGNNPRWPESLKKDPPAGMLLSVSEDGLHWRRWKPEPLFRTTLPNAFDSVNVLFWSEAESQYVLYLRYMTQDIRSFARVTSKDLVQWSEPVPANFGTAPMEHLYTNAATPYFRAPHLTLAFPKRYIPIRKRHDDYSIPGISEAVFMTSRDGVHWNEFPEAFIRPGRNDRNWIHRTTAVAAGVVPTGADEISLFVSRHYTYPSAHIERFTLRTDGFASVTGGYGGGEFVTKPLTFEGQNLILNYATSAGGSVRVEIQDAEGRPIPGFELERCVTLWGDEIEGVVRWERAEKAWTDPLPLGRLAEKPVRLRFVLKDADLYSLRFRP